ncbi:MAG: hypothetical protein Q8R28_01655 [Dehalococcoidia bacterium]|nr:hypothetical protein [Dehalococcoidia bacterium]
MREFKLAVGELVILFKAGEGVSSLTVSPDHRAFLTSEGSPRCVVNVHYGRLPDVDLGEEVFQSGGLWSLHRRNGRLTVPMVSPVWGPGPYRLSVFDASFSAGDIYISSLPSLYGSMNQGMDAGNGEGVIVDPLAYPLDEVLVVNLLAREGGLNIHACGVSLGGRGTAFCGTSGAGKSTMARLWKKRDGDAVLLSDDRLILRRKTDGFGVYGTPWHGEASFSFPGGAPLDRTYFMVQALANKARALSRSEAATRFLVHCFPTFYDATGMERTLSFIEDLCREVPCFELGFVPNDSVLDYLADLGARGG